MRHRTAAFPILIIAGDSIWRSLVLFSEKVLSQLRENMKANMEKYTLLLKTRASIPQRMLTSLQDSTFFKDVLGRTKNLPYECFRYFNVFKSRLRCDFRSLPGEQKVTQGHYVLLKIHVHGQKISKNAWEQLVFPGTKVKISIIIKDMRTHS